jgi:hypothetical protein
MAIRSGDVAYAKSFSATRGSFKLVEVDNALLEHVLRGGK